MRDRARKWLIAGIALGVFGLVVVILGVTILGVILMVAAVADLVIIALGYPSPRDISRTKRALYKEEDPVEHDPDDALVSARLARDDRSEAAG